MKKVITIIGNERVILILKMVKASCGVAAISTAITEGHPYLTVLLMMLGASANEALTYLDKDTQKESNVLPIEKNDVE
ncbi:hypothetical protein KA025_02485 [Candidatus Saccharibacteria bacterium]|nr:hypothetical protein [Candidatus Saccharibacteria bacterium]